MERIADGASANDRRRHGRDGACPDSPARPACFESRPATTGPRASGSSASDADRLAGSPMELQQCQEDMALAPESSGSSRSAPPGKRDLTHELKVRDGSRALSNALWEGHSPPCRTSLEIDQRLESAVGHALHVEQRRRLRHPHDARILHDPLVDAVAVRTRLCRRSTKTPRPPRLRPRGPREWRETLRLEVVARRLDVLRVRRAPSTLAGQRGNAAIARACASGPESENHRCNAPWLGSLLSILQSLLGRAAGADLSRLESIAETP